MRLRSRSSALLLLVCLLGACDSGSLGGGSIPPGAAETAPSAPAYLQTSDVVASTVGGGDVRIRMSVKARMPQEFDDGVPSRRFVGEGILDQSLDVAGITYRLDSVPNAAGYFGHAPGKTSVFYARDSFILSFPVLAKALGGSVDWLSYEVDDFFDREVLRLGIGQLREIGLADPRLGLALLQGATGELAPGPVVTADTPPVYDFSADVGKAARAMGDVLTVPFQTLADLGVRTTDMSLTVDDEQRVVSLQYSLAYPPASKAKDVRMHVQMEFSEYGLDGDLSLPPPDTVVEYEEYLKG